MRRLPRRRRRAHGDLAHAFALDRAGARCRSRLECAAGAGSGWYCRRGERPAIAVLPFANLSPDPENAYFADGLHEEVLATLARAGSLRVISRTSVQQYRDPARNLKEIADALDVDLILEGSVRRAGDDLRLTLQLIDGRTRRTPLGRDLRPQVQQRTAAAEDRRRTGRRGYRSHAFARGAAAHRAGGAHRARGLRRVPARARAHGPVRRPKTGNGPSWTCSTGASNSIPDSRRRLRTPGEDARLALQHLRAGRRGPGGGRPRRHRARACARSPTCPKRWPRAACITPMSRAIRSARSSDLTRALSLAPSDADTHNVAGLTLRRLGPLRRGDPSFRRGGPPDARRTALHVPGL